MILVEQFKTISMEVKVPTTHPVCNPSVLAIEDGWLVLVRALDPVPFQGTHLPYVSSENWLLRYDKDLQLLSSQRLRDERILKDCPEARNGLEDGRLFTWSGQLWVLFSGLRRQNGEYFNTMTLARIDGDSLVEATVIASPYHHTREKNWMPWVLGSDLYLVYSTQPMEIYRYVATGLQRVYQGGVAFENMPGLMSGSSQVIPWGQHYLAITHRRSRAPLFSRLLQKYVTKDPDYQRKKVLFSHYLLLLDRNFNVVGQSPAFRFETEGIEFCAGLACQDQRVLISYGVMDEKARLIELDPANIDHLLGQPERPRNLDRIAPRVTVSPTLPSLDVIILNYRNFQTTAALCLDSLRPQVEGLLPGVCVRLLDNGSPDDSPAHIAAYGQRYPGLVCECLPENLGFAGGMNHAVQQGNGDWVLLVNNDTLFLQGSLLSLVQAMAVAGPDVGAIGPVTNAAGNEQDYFLEGGREQILAAASLFRDHPIHRLLPVYRLDFFCVAVRRKVWESLGGLDTGYGLGYYEDFDFSVRMRRAGYRLMMCEDAFVYHQGGGSFKQSAATKQLIRANRDLFTRRYPEVLLPHKRDGNLATLHLYQELTQAGYPAAFLSERKALRKMALDREMPKSFYKKRQWKKAQAALGFQPGKTA